MDLSIIIPAFNEEERILPTLKALHEYFSDLNIAYEFIVVDDGSTDKTAEIVNNIWESWTTPQEANLRLLSYSENQGKGFAVRFGAINARGEKLLLVDADGAIPASEFSKLNKVLENSSIDVVIGSRAIFSKDTKLETSLHRKYLGRLFNLIAYQLSVTDLRRFKLKDTQCGFKLFTKKAYQMIFPKQTISGFAFDCELLTIASLNKLSIKEVAVNWTNIPGSKVNLLSDPFKMFLELIKIRYQAMKGMY